MHKTGVLFSMQSVVFILIAIIVVLFFPHLPSYMCAVLSVDSLLLSMFYNC